jgi:hypothetical protein
MRHENCADQADVGQLRRFRAKLANSTYNPTMSVASHQAAGQGTGSVTVMDANTLAVAGAQALVQAMTTEAWGEVRDKVARMLSRQKAQSIVLAELDTTSALIRDAPEARDAAERQWKRHLGEALKADPNLADDLNVLMQELAEVLADTISTGDVRQSAVAAGDVNQAGRDNVVSFSHVDPRRRGRR